MQSPLSAKQEVDKEPNANRTFSIDTRGGRGIISLIAPLDYERKHLYQLRIIASVSEAVQWNRSAKLALSLEFFF